MQILHLRPASFLSRRRNRRSRPGQCGFTALDLDVPSHVTKGTKPMLWTICVILLVLWALGMATSYTASGLIHILLVVALVVMVIRLFQGRRVV